MTSTVSRHQERLPRLQTPVDFSALKFLATGTSGAVYAIDQETVLKEFYDEGDGIIERQAYARLGSHPNIVEYFGEASSKAIILERGEPLSTVGQTPAVPVRQKLAWIRDAAEALNHIHSQHIVHGDFGCENMVIVGGRLKIIDFEGCGMDGKESTAAYKWYNRRDLTVDSQSDIFAYGCAVYQILTGKPPHHDLVESQDRSSLVRKLYTENRFPDVRGLPLGELMLGCWLGSFDSMGSVIVALDSLPKPPENLTTLVAYIWDWMVELFKVV